MSSEKTLSTARRELLEESGYSSERWRLLGTYTVSAAQGIANVHVFRASGAVKQQEPCSGDLEEAVVELLARDQLVAAVRNGEVVVGAYLAALALPLLGADPPAGDEAHLSAAIGGRPKNGE